MDLLTKLLLAVGVIALCLLVWMTGSIPEDLIKVWLRTRRRV